MSILRSNEQIAIIVVDLTFGDAGKGSIVDFLTRQYAADLVIRFNGGAQAAHNVISPDGRHHTFAQFGSGMFLPHTQTLLSRFMILDPLAMLNEAEHLDDLGVENPFQRTLIDFQALVISPYQQAANRLKEMARGDNRHGSCGMGVGETAADHLHYGDKMLFAGDLYDEALTAKKLALIRDVKCTEIDAIRQQIPSNQTAHETLAIFDDPELIAACSDVYHYVADLVEIVDEDSIKSVLSSAKVLLFEGAQGVLLDEDYGFHPYTTWSKTTFDNVDRLLDDIGFSGKRIRLGVTRAYGTRHGAGPFVTEDQSLDVEDIHNFINDWQHDFRVGYLDLIALKYALEVADGIDCLAVTMLDRLDEFPSLQICNAYHYTGDPSNLSPYFEHDGQMISGIGVRHLPTLDHQARLTELLFECRPYYQPISKQDYLTHIEQILGVQIGITSHGPTADDKICTSIWHEQFTG